MNTEKNGTSRLKSISTNLMVDDVNKTVHYYQGLGFKVIEKLPEKNPEWAYIQKDNVKLMFQSTQSLQNEFKELRTMNMGGALTLWIQVDNISEFYEQIKTKTNVIKPLGITAYNGAMEFVIQDINGFILHFSNLEL